MIDPTFTQGSFQSLSYRYDSCGTEPAEVTCTWQVHLTLHSDPARRCVPSTPDSLLLWDSGERSGNGIAELGPFNFALEGCRGQVLSAHLEHMKTFNPDDQDGPWKVLSSGGGASLFVIGIGAESVEEIEQKIIAANPGSPSNSPTLRPRLAVSANCRSLKVGATRYAFVFQRMGCHKATNLATMAYLSDAPLRGFRCADKPAGGIRCWRKGQPKRFFGWHLPRQ
jgi:hypothetical protein